MNSIWTEEICDALKALVAEGHSYIIIGDRLSTRFNLTISRNAAIGKAKRLGLVTPEERKEPRKKREKGPSQPKRARKDPKHSGEHHVIYRVVSANGNSNAQKIIRTIEGEMAPLRCVEIIPRGIPLLDLESDGCRYPDGGDKGIPITFCGHPKRKDSSYCVPHHALTHRPFIELTDTERARRAVHGRAVLAEIWSKLRAAQEEVA